MDDPGFLGFVPLGGTLRLPLQCRNSSGTPTTPDAAPTWSIYGDSDTAVITGSLGSGDVDSKDGLRAGNVVVSAGNGFASGQLYYVRFAYEISSSERAAIATFAVT